MLPPNWQQYLPPIVLAAILLFLFWSIVFRPAQASQKRHQELIASLKKGDAVITAGGIYGTIVGLSEETVDLEVAQGVVIKLDRRAIRRRQQDGNP